ncbi:unnamed protein product [Ascophyllum nodosum]
MGKKILFVRAPPLEARPRLGKRRNHEQGLRQRRNPLLEQIMPAPPPKCQRRHHHGTINKGASFDPMRGRFVLLGQYPASGDTTRYDTTPPSSERDSNARTLRPLGRVKDPDRVKSLMNDAEGSPPETARAMPKKRGPPEGMRLDNNLRTGLQLHDVTVAEREAMWDKYRAAMERSLRREGQLDGITWRHRITKAPASTLPLCQQLQHHPRRQFIKPLTVPVFLDVGVDLPSQPPGGKRLVHSGAPKDQAEGILKWDQDQGNAAPPPRKLWPQPPSFAEGPRVYDLMDDERSRRFTSPKRPGRRHLPRLPRDNGYSNSMTVTTAEDLISPKSDFARRELHARRMDGSCIQIK